MSWIATALDQLSALDAWGYHRTAPGASEPTALMALALVAHQRHEAARRPLEWLARVQNSDGSIGITATDTAPGWPTSLAVLAWRAAPRDESSSSASPYKPQIERAAAWLLKTEGLALERTPVMGHDPTLKGWPWVIGTHSWVEPTAWAVLALQSLGRGTNPRVGEALRLLADRLLPTGGCNYGNTSVLGQQLRPHLEPTGVALVALAGERDPSGRVETASTYLRRTLSAETPSMSLAYGLMGLAAQDWSPPSAGAWLEAAYQRTAGRGDAPFKLALLLLAALGAENPLVALPAKGRRLA